MTTTPIESGDLMEDFGRNWLVSHDLGLSHLTDGAVTKLVDMAQWDVSSSSLLISSSDTHLDNLGTTLTYVEGSITIARS